MLGSLLLVFGGQISASDGVVLFGLGASIFGYADKANRHQAQILQALTAIAASKGSLTILAKDLEPVVVSDAVAAAAAAQAKQWGSSGSGALTVKTLTFVLAGLMCAGVARGQAAYRHDGKFELPDASATPGTVNRDLVADPSGKPHMVDGAEANLCAKDFRTGPFRKVDESRKRKACAEYGIATGCPGSAYEIDHLISLEIGGSDDLANLWPQPIAQARLKDHGTEDVLPKLVCSRKISLREAQMCISGDWVKCAARVKALEGR